MGEKTGSKASETFAHGTFDELIQPRIEPGRACLIVIRGRSVGLLHELSGNGPVDIGRAADVELAIDDVAVSRRHAVIDAQDKGFTVSDLDSTNGLFVNGVRTQRHALRDGDRIQIGTTTILKFCYQDDVEADYQRQLYDSATRDALTRTYNRKFFLENLDVDFAHAHKNGSDLTLLLLDLDHFKSINDRFGHLTGDDVLRDTAGLVQASLRTEDILARFGGEEFAVLLRFTTPQIAFKVAERIRKAVESGTFKSAHQEFGLTISSGMSSLLGRNHDTPRDLIQAADEAMYAAKANGRNRTETNIPPKRSTPLQPGDPDATVRARMANVERPTGPLHALPDAETLDLRGPDIRSGEEAAESAAAEPPPASPPEKPHK